VRLSVPEPLQDGWGDGPQSPITRCSMSKAWVTEPGRTSTAERMAELAVTVTENGAP
jgi:hypothetical protein